MKIRSAENSLNAIDFIKTRLIHRLFHLSVTISGSNTSQINWNFCIFIMKQWSLFQLWFFWRALAQLAMSLFWSVMVFSVIICGYCSVSCSHFFVLAKWGGWRCNCFLSPPLPSCFTTFNFYSLKIPGMLRGKSRCL